ncbi:hypothetical protein OKW49_006722 [Paraburkholderia youngii]
MQRRVDARAAPDEQRDRRLFADIGKAGALCLFKRSVDGNVAADVLGAVEVRIASAIPELAYQGGQTALITWRLIAANKTMSSENVGCTFEGGLQE